MNVRELKQLLDQYPDDRKVMVIRQSLKKEVKVVLEDTIEVSLCDEDGYGDVEPVIVLGI